MSQRWICFECGRTCASAEMLSAENPFDPSATVHGCPHCKSVGTLSGACHEPTCTEPASIGEPWPDGIYRHSCRRHQLGAKKS